MSTLSTYEQRLMRHYQRTLRALLEIQADRKAEEQQNEADIYVMARCHASAKVPFKPPTLGSFVQMTEIKISSSVV